MINRPGNPTQAFGVTLLGLAVAVLALALNLTLPTSAAHKPTWHQDLR